MRHRPSSALVAFAAGSLMTATAFADSRPDVLWETAGHGAGVHAIAFSISGAGFATGSEDSHVRIWGLADGAAGPNTQNCCGVYSVAISPDETHFASGSVSALQISRTDNGALFRRWSPGQSFPSVCYSPDGVWLASGAEAGGVKVWDVQSGSLVRNLSAVGPCRDIAFSPDGTRLATTNGAGILIWNTGDWSVDQTLTGAAGTVSSLQYAREGDRILGVDFLPRLWRLSDGTLERSFNSLVGAVASAALSPDGRVVVGNAPINDKLLFWDAATGDELLTFDDATDLLQKTRFSATGRLFAYGQVDGHVVVARNPFWPTGDLDGDGHVNAQDTSRFVDALLGINENPEQQVCADVNEDGALDGRDVAVFAEALIGM
ncbi:MAG TPA: dockerin type I domain-containing protein [Phycisphaerae bacterium]|nr:dockerin type I domain-containing protein [Phycisphaerae bacterium]